MDRLSNRPIENARVEDRQYTGGTGQYNRRGGDGIRSGRTPVIELNAPRWNQYGTVEHSHMRNTQCRSMRRGLNLRK